MRFEFETHNLNIVLQEIEEVEKFLNSNLARFYRGPATDVMKKVFVDIFRGEGKTARTQRWPALKQSTIEARKKRYPYRKNQKILRASGLLRKSYIRYPLVRTVGREMRISSTVPYAKYHEYGTRHMAARPVLRYAEHVAPTRLVRAFNKEFSGKFRIVVLRR